MTSIAITIAARSSLFEQANPPLTPVTSAQWRSALQEIKLLYIQKQYKRCVARSSSILTAAREPIDPVCKLYLHFYSAICYEAMGMYAHKYSSKKVPLLREALGCLAACLSAFPAEIELRQVLRRDSGVSLGSDIEFGPGLGREEDGDGCSDGVFLAEPSGVPHDKVDASARSISSSSSSSPCASTARSRSRSRPISPADSTVTSITDTIYKTLICPDDDPFLSESDCEDILDTGFDVGLCVKSEDADFIQGVDWEGPYAELKSNPEPEQRLVPSPLQVRKSKPSSPLPLMPASFVCYNENSNTYHIQHSHPQCKTASASMTKPRPRPLPSLPTSINLGVDLAATTRRTNADATAPAYVYTPGQSAAFVSPSANIIAHSHLHEYNSNLSFLHAQITNTVTHLQTLIQDVTAAQQAHATSRRTVGGGFQRSASFWLFSPVRRKNCDEDKDESNPTFRRFPSSGERGTSSYGSCSRPESIQDRIARLRADGWETVGLKNPKRGWKGADYYKGFCGMVLDELYLG
ncbi:hypothetical protein BDW66DRAFT_149904 [Aspergillus desertorum]